MVVWVYAGGGQAEFGLVPFLQRHFPEVIFERRTPQKQKRGPRPGNTTVPYGTTGEHFQKVVREKIAEHWNEGVDILLVIDDLDCDDYETKKAILENSVQQGLIEATKRGVVAVPKSVVVGFATPEIEAWIIADWKNTFETIHRKCHQALKYSLSDEGVDFKHTESFDCRCGTDNYRKISEVLQSSFNEKCSRDVRYSKDTDTRELLNVSEAQNIERSCPRFKELWSSLTKAVTLPNDDSL